MCLRARKLSTKGFVLVQDNLVSVRGSLFDENSSFSSDARYHMIIISEMLPSHRQTFDSPLGKQGTTSLNQGDILRTGAMQGKEIR